ncbi:aldo/keto reductase [Streptomyces sp. NPDC059618]|uniref:aldo/keto reductase n=1 Tax=Streptomyces sp. NPDC059618 TaxID=3346887 RepID=UPI0036CE66C3
MRAGGPRTASIAEHFGALARLRDAGLIRHLGLSAVLPEHVTEAQTITPVVCVQNSYGLDWRRADENGLADMQSMTRRSSDPVHELLRSVESTNCPAWLMRCVTHTWSVA